MTQLAFYWQLSSNLKEERINAAAQLVEYVASPQENDDIDYALKRLLRGLPSSREGSRQGFSLALCELLSHVPASVTFSRIHALLEEYTNIVGGMKGREERDMYFGKLFGIHALVQSTLLNNPSTKVEDIQNVISLLLKYAAIKSYMKEACFGIIITILMKLQHHKSEIHLFIRNCILKKGIDQPETLWLAITCQNLSIDIGIDATLDPKWKNKESLLSSENHKALAEILKETTFAHPHIHEVWDTIILNIIENKSMSIQDFWHYLIENNLFDSSHERKYLGFQLFLLLLPQMTTATLPLIFTTNFMRTFVNNLSSQKNILYKSAKQVANELANTAKNNSHIGFQIILQVENGMKNFDGVTKTKTIETVMSLLDLSTVEAYLDYLLSSFDATSSSKLRNNAWVFDQISILIKNGAIPKSQSIISKALNFFTSAVFKDSNEKALVKLTSMLGDLLTLCIDGKKQPGTDTGSSWCSIILSNDHFIQNFEQDEELKKVLLIARELVLKIEEMKNNHDTSSNLSRTRLRQLHAYESLVSHALFMSSVDREILGSFPDIVVCFENFFSVTDKLSTKRKHEPIVESGDLNPYDVLLDILIEFMSKPSFLLRGVCENTFKMFCDGLTMEGMNLILGVLDGNDAFEEDVGSDDEAELNDANVVEESDNMSDSEGEEKDDTKMDALRALISKENPGILQNSDSEEEEYLNDDEMEVFDDKLVEIFKQKKEIKENKKTAKDLHTHFKARLLGFVEIFIKAQSSNPILLSLVLPLLRLSLKTSNEFHMHAKISNILKNNLVNTKDVCVIEVEDGLSIITEIHKIASRSSESEFLVMCSGLCILVTKSILKNEELQVKRRKESKTTSVFEKIGSIYDVSIEKMMTDKQCQLSTKFFDGFCVRYSTIGWNVCHVAALSMKVGKACKPYLILEGMKLILILIQRISLEVNSIQNLSLINKINKSHIVIIQRVFDEMRTNIKDQFLSNDRLKDSKHGREMSKILTKLNKSCVKIGIVDNTN